ncbi:MAG: hypothetical protein GKS06_06090 [Acidobacteria bacterium]|nr:hypothetical protein [Acidobacteriota bacterium]
MNFTHYTVATAALALSLPALGQEVAQSAKGHKPISSTVQINVVIENSEAIKDLPNKHIRWYPPVHEFSDRSENFIDLVKNVPKKNLQIGCAGGFSQYPDTSKPAQNTPTSVTVEIKQGTKTKSKKFATVTGNVVAFTGVWIGLVQKKIKASTTYFDFWITHAGTGNTNPNMLMSYNCGVFAIDGKGGAVPYGTVEVIRD